MHLFRALFRDVVMKQARARQRHTGISRARQKSSPVHRRGSIDGKRNPTGQDKER